MWNAPSYERNRISLGSLGEAGAGESIGSLRTALSEAKGYKAKQKARAALEAAQAAVGPFAAIDRQKTRQAVPDIGGEKTPTRAPGPFAAVDRQEKNISGPFGAIERQRPPERISDIPGVGPTFYTADPTPGGQYPLGTPLGRLGEVLPEITKPMGGGLTAGAMLPALNPALVPIAPATAAAGGLAGLMYGLYNLARDPYSTIDLETATHTGQYPDDPGWQIPGLDTPLSPDQGGAGGSPSLNIPIGTPPINPEFPGRIEQMGPEKPPPTMPEYTRLPLDQTPQIPTVPTPGAGPELDPFSFQYRNRFTGQPLTPEEFFNLLSMARRQ